MHNLDHAQQLGNENTIAEEVQVWNPNHAQLVGNESTIVEEVNPATKNLEQVGKLQLLQCHKKMQQANIITQESLDFASSCGFWI